VTRLKRNTASFCIFFVLTSPAAARQTADSEAFEVASVKPFQYPPNIFGGAMTGISPIRRSGNRLSAHGSVPALIAAAYSLKEYQVIGTPDFRDPLGRLQIYQIDAKAAQELPSMDTVRAMFRKLMADRFQLKCHSEKKEIPVYELRHVRPVLV
jgi:uncharacterized protein (TIGR03435 family)